MSDDNNFAKFASFHRDVAEDSNLVVCWTVFSGKQSWTFRRIVVSSFSLVSLTLKMAALHFFIFLPFFRQMMA
jgi:riboflavin transporter FmnP